jgi:DMSO/TMAO reductase YedYZ molybdopterin-dependent catalytic subunit
MAAKVEGQGRRESWAGKQAGGWAARRPGTKVLRAIIAGVVAGTLIIVAGGVTGRASASNTAATIKFQNHQWSPLNVTVPANQAMTIQVVNASNETIEFESFKLNRETAMTPGETITVHLPALSPGNYDFYDDFHQDVPQGSIVAK